MPLSHPAAIFSLWNRSCFFLPQVCHTAFIVLEYSSFLSSSDQCVLISPVFNLCLIREAFLNYHTFQLNPDFLLHLIVPFNLAYIRSQYFFHVKGWGINFLGFTSYKVSITATHLCQGSTNQLKEQVNGWTLLCIIGIVNLSIFDIFLVWIVLCCRDCPVYCKIFSSFPIILTRCQQHPQVVIIKNVLPNVPGGENNPQLRANKIKLYLQKQSRFGLEAGVNTWFILLWS